MFCSFKSNFGGEFFTYTIYNLHHDINHKCSYSRGRSIVIILKGYYDKPTVTQTVKHPDSVTTRYVRRDETQFGQSAQCVLVYIQFGTELDL